MIKLLLDTQVLLWLLNGDSRLSRKARERIEDPDSELYLSAASVWEIAIKTALGRLEMPHNAGQLTESLLDQGLRPLAVEWSHAVAVRALPLHHRDPFDRMLVAQARMEGMTLVSADKALKAYAIPMLW